MEGLLRRLSAADSEAEKALRVIAFFDQLLVNRGGLQDLVRATARLVGAPTGFESEVADVSLHSTPPGYVPTGQEARRQRAVGTSDVLDGEVWICSAEDDSALLDLVIERMSMAANVILGRQGVAPVTGAPAALTLGLDSSVPEHRRVQALRSIGLQVDDRLCVVLLRDEPSSQAAEQVVAAWARSVGGRATGSARFGSDTVVVTHGVAVRSLTDVPTLPGRVAVGAAVTAADAPTSLETARRSMRLTSALFGPRVVVYDQLGALEPLARLTPREAAANGLARKLMDLEGTKSGVALIKDLDAFCRHSSVRAAASELNMHHSSLAARIESVARVLDVRLDEPDGRLQASIALVLFKIARSD